jgi:hypothetical protein
MVALPTDVARSGAACIAVALDLGGWNKRSKSKNGDSRRSRRVAWQA